MTVIDMQITTLLATVYAEALLWMWHRAKRAERETMVRRISR